MGQGPAESRRRFAPLTAPLAGYTVARALLCGSRYSALCGGYRLGCADGHRRVAAGDTVLTLGAGGVSVFALQFAQLLGARMIATTSTAEKAERLRALGTSKVINYRETPNRDEKARELTDGRGVDWVVEIGGPGTIAMSLRALAVGPWGDISA